MTPGRRAAEFPAGFRCLAHGAHQRDGGAEGHDEEQEIVPGNAIERRLLRSRKDQERERQHQRDQQIEVFGVELGIADKESQRELLVDAEQDGGRGGNDQRPSPHAAQRTHARDFGLLQIGSGAMGVSEFDPFWRRDCGAIGYGHHRPPKMVFAFNASRYSKPFGMAALSSAAARAFIQPSRKALSSEGGLPLVYPAQAAGQHFLTLEQLVVVGFLLVRPLAGFLQRLDGAGMHRNHPVLGLLVGGKTARAGRGSPCRRRSL